MSHRVVVAGFVENPVASAGCVEIRSPKIRSWKYVLTKVPIENPSWKHVLTNVSIENRPWKYVLTKVLIEYWGLEEQSWVRLCVAEGVVSVVDVGATTWFYIWGRPGPRPQQCDPSERHASSLESLGS